jgi:hypothetical protein
MLYYDSGNNTLTISGWVRSTPSRPPADAVAGPPTLSRRVRRRALNAPAYRPGARRRWCATRIRPTGLQDRDPSERVGHFRISGSKAPLTTRDRILCLPRPPSPAPPRTPNRQFAGRISLPADANDPGTEEGLRVIDFKVTHDPSALNITAAHPHARVIHTPPPSCPSRPTGIVGLRCLGS